MCMGCARRGVGIGTSSLDIDRYVNGYLDTAVALSAPPIANTGPLWVGKDSSNAGMDGLVRPVPNPFPRSRSTFTWLVRCPRSGRDGGESAPPTFSSAVGNTRFSTQPNVSNSFRSCHRQRALTVCTVFT